MWRSAYNVCNEKKTGRARGHSAAAAISNSLDIFLRFILCTLLLDKHTICQPHSWGNALIPGHRATHHRATTHSIALTVATTYVSCIAIRNTDMGWDFFLIKEYKRQTVPYHKLTIVVSWVPTSGTRVPSFREIVHVWVTKAISVRKGYK